MVPTVRRDDLVGKILKIDAYCTKQFYPKREMATAIIEFLVANGIVSIDRYGNITPVFVVESDRVPSDVMKSFADLMEVAFYGPSVPKGTYPDCDETPYAWRERVRQEAEQIAALHGIVLTDVNQKEAV